MALINQTPEEYYLGPDGVWDSGDESYGDYQFVSITDIGLKELFKNLALIHCLRKNLLK